MVVSSDSNVSNQSESDFKWEEKNDKLKLLKFIFIGGINENITADRTEQTISAKRNS